jgi:copper(I)-binding protein
MSIATKNLGWAVGLMILGTAVVGAQQTSAPPATVTPPTNAVGPKIQFATPVYEFGKVRAGEPIKYTFVFTNTGDRVLVLNSVQPQCGCTTAGEWTKQVEPGNTGTIPIQVNTLGYNGLVIKQVTVTCNVASQPTTFLQLKGTLYKPIDFNPPLAVLNLPPDAETASAVVTITNNTDEPLMLAYPESNNRMFSAQLLTNTPGKGFQLTVSVVPPVSTGSVQGQVNLRTGWTNPVVLTVPVVANIQPAVMVIPSYFALAPAPLATAVTNSVTIQNNSTNALQLSEPVVNVPGVEARINEIRPGRAFTAMLAFPQGFTVPPGQPVELTVKSTNPKYPVIKVPVMQMPRSVSHPPATLAAPQAPAAPLTPPKPHPQAVATQHPPPPPPPPLPVSQ